MVALDVGDTAAATSPSSVLLNGVALGVGSQEGQDGSDEEEDSLDDEQGSTKLNQSGNADMIRIVTTSLAGRDEVVSQDIIIVMDGVVAAVDDCRGKISSKDDNVEESGNPQQGAAEEADRDD